MRQHIIYLAGGMGGHEYNKMNCWRHSINQVLRKYNILGLSPLRGKEFLQNKIIDEAQYEHESVFTKPQGITTRDKFDLMRSDLVFMNLLDCEDTISIGSCIEIGWANAYDKPLVLLCEKDGKYDQHPMIQHIAGFKIYTTEEILPTILSILGITYFVGGIEDSIERLKNEKNFNCS